MIRIARFCRAKGPKTVEGGGCGLVQVARVAAAACDRREHSVGGALDRPRPAGEPDLGGERRAEDGGTQEGGLAAAQARMTLPAMSELVDDLQRLGVASYEVFLVQVVWLGVLVDRGQVPFLVAVLGSGLLGWALHRALTATAVGSLGLRRGALART